MSKVNVQPTLEAASRQLGVATGKVIGLLASRSVGERPKLIYQYYLSGKGDRSRRRRIAVNRRNRLILFLCCLYSFIYIYVRSEPRKERKEKKKKRKRKEKKEKKRKRKRKREKKEENQEFGLDFIILTIWPNKNLGKIRYFRI